MRIMQYLSKPSITLITACLFSLGLLSGTAQAQIVDTESLINQSQVEQHRKHVQDSLNREEVRQKMTELGVNPADVQTRIDSMTNEEIQTLAQNIDSLPAGGGTDTITILLIIIIIILLI